MQEIKNLMNIQNVKGSWRPFVTPYPALLYNENDINHGADTITNRGTSGGTLSMSGFTRNNGTVSGGVTIADDAMVFDGDRDHGAGTGTRAEVNITTGLNFTQTDYFSISGKFTVNSLPPNNVTGLFGSDKDVGLHYDSTGTLTFFLRGSSITSYNSSVTVGNTYTVHLIYIQSEAKFYCYMDGVLLNSGGTAGPTTFTTNFWGIGDRYIGFGDISSGGKDVHYFRIYNKALSSAEISQETASGTYSTITDGSLVGQRTGVDYAGTASVPTTIYDTNMVVNTDTTDVNKTGIVFDGVDDKLVFSPALTDAKTDTKSISGRFKLNADGVDTATSLQIFSLKYIYAQIRTSTNTIFIRYDNSGAKVSPYYYLGNGDRTLHSFVGQVINNGDGTYNTNMWIDGSLVGTATHAVGPDFDYTRDEGIGLGTFDGVISNVQIYNKALTAGEIARLSVGIGPK